MAKILLVEDTPDNIRLFRAILGRRGHEVVELVSGDRLVEVADEAKPDLVLLDIQLPGRDGYQLLSDLRQHQGDSKRVKVVALTAHAYDVDRDRALGAGFDGYITKPIDVRDFSRQVELYL